MKTHGSIINRTLESPPTRPLPEPKVGDGATVICYSDRHAATVVEITKNKIVVQHDIATRMDTNGRSEDQSYAYTRNPNGRLRTFRRTSRGWRDSDGNGLYIGGRMEYYDFSF